MKFKNNLYKFRKFAQKMKKLFIESINHERNCLPLFPFKISKVLHCYQLVLSHISSLRKKRYNVSIILIDLSGFSNQWLPGGITQRRFRLFVPKLSRINLKRATNIVMSQMKTHQWNGFYDFWNLVLTMLQHSSWSPIW